MATIKFSIRSNKNPARIYVRVRNGRSLDLKIPTNWHINPTEWNADSGKPKRTNQVNLKKLSQSLNLLYSDILALINTSETAQVNPNELKALIDPKRARKQAIPSGLVDYYLYYIEHLKRKADLGRIAKTTVTKYKGNMRIIEGMQKHYGEHYQVKDVNLNFIEQLEGYCQNIMLYNTNTTGRAIKFLKTVCRHARINGVPTDLQLDAIKGYSKKIGFIVLSWDDLKAIGEAQLNSEHLENARDWLLISCYTGQRVSDFLDFDKNKLSELKDSKGNAVPIIDFVQKKTGKHIKLPYGKLVQSILDKREGDFPRKISSQKYNEYIKEVCKIAGINNKVQGAKHDPESNRKKEGVYERWELVTSHIGRRSFASNYYGKIPTPSIMYATGHSTEQMLLRYIGKTNQDRALELAKYF